MIQYQCYSNNLFLPRAQLVEVRDSAVLGRVVKVLSSNPTWVINIIQHFFLIVLLFYVHGKHLRSCRNGQLT